MSRRRAGKRRIKRTLRQNTTPPEAAGIDGATQAVAVAVTVAAAAAAAAAVLSWRAAESASAAW
ncbi:MAG: hypothetical protein ABJO54_04925 [Hyphomicrobiales bacterium]